MKTNRLPVIRLFYPCLETKATDNSLEIEGGAAVDGAWSVVGPSGYRDALVAGHLHGAIRGSASVRCGIPTARQQGGEQP